jgi:hypothetical protein
LQHDNFTNLCGKGGCMPAGLEPASKCRAHPRCGGRPTYRRAPRNGGNHDKLRWPEGRKRHSKWQSWGPRRTLRCAGRTLRKRKDDTPRSHPYTDRGNPESRFHRSQIDRRR